MFHNRDIRGVDSRKEDESRRGGRSGDEKVHLIY